MSTVAECICMRSRMCTWNDGGVLRCGKLEIAFLLLFRGRVTALSFFSIRGKGKVFSNTRRSRAATSVRTASCVEHPYVIVVAVFVVNAKEPSCARNGKVARVWSSMLAAASLTQPRGLSEIFICSVHGDLPGGIAVRVKIFEGASCDHPPLLRIA